MSGMKPTVSVSVRIFEPVAVLCLIQMTFLFELEKKSYKLSLSLSLSYKLRC